MPLDSLDDVRLFRQVVAAGGISAAARVLRASKNRVSQRLAALEAGLGVRLADRTTRSFQLTEEGARFLAASEGLLEAVESCEASVASPRAREGRVRLALTSAVADLGLGHDLARLMRTAPKLELQLLVEDEATDPRAQGFDVLIRAGDLPDSSLMAQPLGKMPIVLAAAPEYLARQGRPESPADLVTHQCLRKGSGASERTWTLLDREGRARKVPIRGSLECSDARLQRDVLYAGGGIAPHPASEVLRAEDHGLLERVLPGWSFASVPVWALGERGRFRLARVAQVIDLFRQTLARYS